MPERCLLFERLLMVLLCHTTNDAVACTESELCLSVALLGDETEVAVRRVRVLIDALSVAAAHAKLNHQLPPSRYCLTTVPFA